MRTIIPLFTAVLFSNLLWANTSSTCSVARQLVTQGDKTFYVVGPRAYTLYMISRDLYGTEKHWKKLAEWNQLTEPYAIGFDDRLLIKIPPRLSEDQGNKVLIKAWAAARNPHRAQKLKEFDSPIGLACSPSKPDERIPATETTTETATTMPTAHESTSTQTLESPPPPASTAGRWGLRTDLLSSIFRLEDKMNSTGTGNTIYSRLNYGAEARVSYHSSERLGYSLGASLEHIDMEPAAGGPIVIEKENLIGAMAGLDLQLAEPFILYFNGHYIQRPFTRSTVSGATVDAVYIPEARLGARLRLLNWDRLQTWLVTEGMYSFSAKQGLFEVKSGHGYTAGLRFEHRLQNSVLSATGAYRFLKQDTQTSKNSQVAGLLMLGLSL